VADFTNPMEALRGLARKDNTHAIQFPSRQGLWFLLLFQAGFIQFPVLLVHGCPPMHPQVVFTKE